MEQFIIYIRVKLGVKICLMSILLAFSILAIPCRGAWKIKLSETFKIFANSSQQ